jgi:hypothetical protein
MKRKSLSVSLFCLALLAGCNRPTHVVETYPELRALQMGLEIHFTDTGRHPATLLDLISPDPFPPSWGGPWIKSTNMLVDAWDTPYKYKATGAAYSITSAGPDRRFGTTDDFTIRETVPNTAYGTALPRRP